MEDTRDSWFGKMLKEHYRVTKEKTFVQSSKRLSKSKVQMLQFLDLRTENGTNLDASWEMISPSLGDSMMLNIGASPNVVKESHLSQILEDSPPQKYYLSQKACLGILRRAKRRGKKLPTMLEAALIRQSIAYKGTELTVQTLQNVTEQDGAQTYPTR